MLLTIINDMVFVLQKSIGVYKISMILVKMLELKSYFQCIWNY